MKIDFTTERKFVTDVDCIAKFNKQSIASMLVASAIVTIPLFLLAIAAGKEGWPVVLIVIFTLLISTLATLQRAERFQYIRIKLSPTSVKREGPEFRTTEIFYSEIGRVVVKRHGLIIIKKGLSANFQYYLSKRSLGSVESIIFIPSLIQDYDSLKEFFVGIQNRRTKTNHFK